jgi:penicillin V acylase-like amidase (Ntn superfamily)
VDAPMDGLNEAGFVVAQMWLDGTRYPPAGSRPGVGVLSWIQYHLDNPASVQDVIKGDKKIRIDPELSAPLHFLVCDISGQVAVIEFLDGKMVVHTGKNLPYAALANSTYSASLQHLKNKKSKLSSPDRSWSANSMENSLQTTPHKQTRI